MGQLSPGNYRAGNAGYVNCNSDILVHCTAYTYDQLLPAQYYTDVSTTTAAHTLHYERATNMRLYMCPYRWIAGVPYFCTGHT